jgi:hypothetical protein
MLTDTDELCGAVEQTAQRKLTEVATEIVELCKGLKPEGEYFTYLEKVTLAYECENMLRAALLDAIYQKDLEVKRAELETGQKHPTGDTE